MTDFSNVKVGDVITIKHPFDREDGNVNISDYFEVIKVTAKRFNTLSLWSKRDKCFNKADGSEYGNGGYNTAYPLTQEEADKARADVQKKKEQQETIRFVVDFFKSTNPRPSLKMSDWEKIKEIIKTNKEQYG